MLALLPLLLAAPAAALDPGPHAVSAWDEWFYNEEAGGVWTRVHYPAESDSWGADPDTAAGPFPVIVFIHGALGSAWMYSQAADHLASQGFVVLNIDTEWGPWIDTDRLAKDAHGALLWLDEASADDEHWLAGMADGGPVTAMGHSMGGIAMARLVGAEPRVQRVVGFAPYAPESDEHEAYAGWEGEALFLGGDEDDTSTPAILEDWFQSLDDSSRGLYLSIEGAGHQAITDFEFGQESMADAEQLEVVVDLATDFLLAGHLDEEDRYGSLICALPAEVVDHRSQSLEPVTWARGVEALQAELGLAHVAGTTAVIYAGRGPGETQTEEHDTIELRDAVELRRLALPEGVACENLALPEELAGIAWVQVAFEGADGLSLGRQVDVFGVGDPGEGDEGGGDEGGGDEGGGDEGGDEAGGDEGGDAGGEQVVVDQGGCAVAPGRSGAGLALLLVGLLLPLRRRS